jgi:hypothetical protein
MRKAAGLPGGTLRAVQKAIASKRIRTLPDGSIDPEQANRDWIKNTFAGQTLHVAPVAAPSRSSSPIPLTPTADGLGDSVSAYLRARAVNETYKARVANSNMRNARAS